MTGADFLRFSGAEIQSQPQLMGEVLDAYVEARIIQRVGFAGEWAALVRKQVLELTALPILRHRLHSQAAVKDIQQLRDLLESIRAMERAATSQRYDDSE